LACKGPTQEADANEQNGKPICKRKHLVSINKECREDIKIVAFLTFPMLEQTLAAIWNTKMQLQHISFPRSNDQDIWIPPVVIA
jgi:hypothetical protein